MSESNFTNPQASASFDAAAQRTSVPVSVLAKAYKALQSSCMEMVHRIEELLQSNQRKDLRILELEQKLVEAEHKLSESELNSQYESLTGLLRKESFEKKFASVFKDASNKDMRREYDRKVSKDFTFMLIDVNGLKEINDKLGHRAGDELISFVATKISNLFERPEDFGGRIGGDELAFVMPRMKPELAFERINELRRGLHFFFEGIRIDVQFAVGVTSFNDQKNEKQVSDEADKGMYLDKKSMKADGRTTIFTPAPANDYVAPGMVAAPAYTA